jgi:hypothetical protein
VITLSQLLQRGLSDLGRTDTFTAAAGTTTTADRGDFEQLNQQPSDNYAVNFSLFVNKSTDGLAPEGEFGLVQSYSVDNHRYTLYSALTAVIAAGDEIVIADSLFPLREMILRANRGLEKFEEIVAVDTSITTDSNKREYSLPAKVARRPYAVEIQTITNDADDNQYIPVYDWDIIPGVPGSAGLLVFDHQPEADRLLKIQYGGLHPTLTAYSSQVSETIHPSLAVAAFVESALEWFLGRVAGNKQNNFWMNRWNDAKRNLEIAQAKYAIPKPEARDKLFIVDRWSYDPDEGYYVV